jgi:hypothetical protein
VNVVQRLADGRAERTILMRRKLLRAAGIDFRVGGLGGWEVGSEASAVIFKLNTGKGKVHHRTGHEGPEGE